VEVSVKLHAPTAIPPEKEFWHPFNSRLDGPQSRSGYFGEKTISWPVPEIAIGALQMVA